MRAPFGTWQWITGFVPLAAVVAVQLSGCGTPEPPPAPKPKTQEVVHTTRPPSTVKPPAEETTDTTKTTRRPRVYRLPPPLRIAPVVQPVEPAPAPSNESLPSLPVGIERDPLGPELDGPIADNEADAMDATIDPESIPPANDFRAEQEFEPSRGFEIEEFDEEAQRALESSADDVLAYFPAEDELSVQIRPQVQAAFTLARNGALHAARARFEQLLADLANTKDACQMSNRHGRALAAGLRALAEADDFLKAGCDSDADARSLASGHQTPMLHESDCKWTLPHEAIAMYHVYAQQKLAAAVEGEQAGSMVLFGLAKIHAQLAERDDAPQALRKSLTLYRSAFAAHDGNYLAANEAGVLLARAGRYAAAAELLQKSASLRSLSTTHHNLAYVHHKLGDLHLAEQHRSTAADLALNEVARGQLSAERGIAWVSPDEFNRRSSGSGGAVVASRPAPASTPPAEDSAAQPQAQTAETHPKDKPRPQQTMWW